jgi:hypothetical protein
MLIPALAPLCLSSSSGGALTTGGSLQIGLAALLVHTLAMLVTIAAVSVVVYERVGLAFLRTRWINLDLVWVIALGASGVLLLLL